MIIRETDKKSLKLLKAKLINGSVAIIPSFTIYGFSASLYSSFANKRLFELKKRHNLNPFIVIANYPFIKGVADNVNLELLDILLHSYATVIIKTKIRFPFYADKDGKTAFRLANTRLLKSLTSLFPITSTSVNISGKRQLNDIRTICERYSNTVDIIVNGSVKNIQSTIVDLTVSNASIVRHGYNVDRIKEFV